MASNTSNLNLLKKDPLTDGKDTFNIKTMLNDNWDKIDEFAGKTIPISRGGTGATTAEQALANLGGISASAVGNLHVWESVQSGVTDYLTSTDRNAYPDNVTDAQDAYYSLGDVVTGSFRMSSLVPRNAYLYEYSNSVEVNENGDVFLQNPEAVNFNFESYIGYESTVLSLVAGKFLRYVGRDGMVDDSRDPDTQPPFNATPSEIIYVPADAVITGIDTYPDGFYLDKYQPVTGHAAIPANTTITYLGQLGGGARIEVGSYVGTGTYGSSSPTEIFVGEKAKVFIMISVTYSSGYRDNAEFGDTTYKIFLPDFAGNSYHDVFNSAAAHLKFKNGIIYVYGSSEEYQANVDGGTYYYLVIY